MLSLIAISQDFGNSGIDGATYSVTSALMMALYNWSFIIGTLVFLGLGGIPMYYLMYKSRMVPRWLAAWGIIGAVSVLIYGIISLFGQDPAFLAAPIGIQEMVFAVWLIKKGFNVPPAISEEEE